MQLKTRVFELSNGKYTSIKELARAMGVSWYNVDNMRKGKCRVNQKFIIGATKAFPGYKLDDLFYVAPEGSPTPQKPALRFKVLLTTSDVAQFLGVHLNTVRRWSRKGILKSYRISPRGDIRFRREDVDRFLKERESK